MTLLAAIFAHFASVRLCRGSEGCLGALLLAVQWEHAAVGQPRRVKMWAT
jgi:hypothetical protein